MIEDIEGHWQHFQFQNAGDKLNAYVISGSYRSFKLKTYGNFLSVSAN